MRAADKASKARELRLAFARTAPASGGRRSAKSLRKLAHYRHCAELLEDRLADSPLVESLRQELAQLEVAEHALLVAAP